MNIAKYRALLVAVDMGSFSAAAGKLGCTQSGLTHMMNGLEDEIGFPLLQRGHYGIKLTPGGESLIQKIRELVASDDALNTEIEMVRSLGDNTLRVGAYSSMASCWLPTVVDRFSSELPDINVVIQTGTVGELCGGLSDGRFDILYGSVNTKYDFRWMPIAKDRFYAVLPMDYPIVGDEFDITRFNGTKFLMPGLGFDHDISAVFEKYNVKPFVTETYVDDPAIISMVSHRHGVSMLSELIVGRLAENVRCVPIVPEVCRELAIATKPDAALSPAARRLITLTKEYVKETGRPLFGNIE